MNKLPLVSTIIATRNRAEYLEKAIASVFGQTYKNIELIIADDNSTDKTQETIKPYLRDARVRYIYQKKQEGPGQTRNNAIKTAKGEYVAVLDSDDFWSDPRKIEKQVNFLKNNPDYVVAGGGVIRIDKTGKEIRRVLPPENHRDIINVMLFKNPFAHSSVLFKKSAWQEAGGYDKNISCGEDWDLWLKMGKLGKFYNFQENFAYYLQWNENISNISAKEDSKNRIAMQKKYCKDYPGCLRAFFLTRIRYFFHFYQMSYNKNTKIKICYITSADITIKFILFNQLKFLKREGYDVYIVCSTGKWQKEIEKEGFKVKNIGFKRKISPFSDLIALIQLFFYLKKEKFDIVHTHTPKASLIGQLAAKFAGVPIIINTVHGFYFQREDSWKKRKFYILINKITAMCSDLVFFVNKEDMKTAIREKICSQYLMSYFGGGIDMERFNPKRFSEEFIFEKKKQFGISPGHKTIGIVARLVKEKGYMELFRAFQMILKDFPKTSLLIVGSREPEKKDAIRPANVKKYKIWKNVVFLGERTDVDEIYALMDIFVLPSHREGLGMSILEASAMEKPVVGADIRGVREAIDSGKTGILVPAKNSEKLAKAIIYFLENPEEAEKMGKNGRIKVIEEFDERLVFSRIRDNYQKLIEKKLNQKSSPKKIQLALKRIFDFIGALAGLILLSPVFFIVAVLIKIDSAGSVFFRQERIGKGGMLFYPFKFRTMIEGAVNKGLGYTVAKDDDRITKIGKFLRKWGVDEFPQLINVLKGEMSLVGPRPTLRYQVEKYNDFEKRRLLVKPGLAGWALIHGRNSLTWEERIKHDVWYVDNWSFWLDIKIIFKTFHLIFIKQEGVYGKGGVNDPFIK